MIEGMISVVLPVYNAEKYLRRAIQSVLDQTYQNFEIIAVNDGSTDHSLEILNTLDDPRVRIISKENTGVSDARNIAIDAAKGEYICFLDADDCFASNLFQRMNDVISKKTADMVVYNYTPFRDRPIWDETEAEIVLVNSSEKLIQLGLMTSVWTKFIKITTIKRYNIKFDKNMSFGEDMFFCWKVFLASNKVWFIDEKLYGYRITDGGATSKYHPKLYEKYKVAFLELKTFGKTVGKDDECAMDIFFTTRMPSFVRMTIRERNTLGKKRERILEILNDSLIRDVLASGKMFEGTHNNKQRKYYYLCQERKVLNLLVNGYMDEIKRIVKSFLYKRGGNA